MLRATEADRPAIESFLLQHAPIAMFPLANLRDHGMSGGHPRAMSFWVSWQAGRITDLLSVSDEGMIFPCCPTGPWADIAAVLAGTLVKGILGASSQVQALRDVLRLPPTAGLDAVEPRYQLDLDALEMPPLEGLRLVPLAEAARALMIAWRAAYLEEVLPMPGEEFLTTATTDIDRCVAKNSHRALYLGNKPVAHSGFNAALPEIVQIGGVYTPPALRSRGYARACVALHLAEAHLSGVSKAVLFASSPQACKAYESIGFRREGDFAIFIYPEPQVIYG